jgi:hypothetical protein
MALRPGLSTRIVTDVDVTKERILVKGSIVYDVQEPTVILAQTDPPILKSMLHRDVIVTYLTKEKDDEVRYGFTAELVEFIDYSLSSGQEVKALVVKRTGPEKPYSIRMSYRVAPTGRSNMIMSVYANKVNIIDISVGGAKFTYAASLTLKADEIVQVGLEIDGRDYTLEARILRAWQGDSQGASSHLWFASAEFVNTSKTMEQVLSRKIREIELESRQRETSR